MPVLAKLVDPDLLRFASQRLITFVSLSERSAVFERRSARWIAPEGKYWETGDFPGMPTSASRRRKLVQTTGLQLFWRVRLHQHL